jgi:hypothetical protein
MSGKGDEPSTTDGLQYPMVDLFTGGTMLPLMFINSAAAWYLLSLNAPLAFLEAWSDALERGPIKPGEGQGRPRTPD